MIKITAIVPYKEMGDLIKEVFKSHNENIHKPEYENDEYELEVVVAVSAVAVRELKLDTDVIMARGATAYFLREKNYYIPVVEIPLSVNSVASALHEGINRFGKKKIGVIGSINMVMGVEKLSYILNLEIKTYVYSDNSEIKKYVDQAVRDGVEVVIGGVFTCAYADELGLKTVLIKTGNEEVKYALSEAKRVASLSRKEQEKALRFKTILDYTSEGIIAVDDKNIISVFNAFAEKILHINAQKAVGNKFEDVIPGQLQKALEGDEKESFGKLIQYNDINLAVNKVSIILKSENLGTVFTFHDVTNIQEMESIIRKKIYSRGHIAKHTFKDIIGKSKKIRHVIEIAKSFSKVDSNILVLGETGTGKELFAQSIHNHSPRSKGPFVAVNCAALPESLLESELFGYAEGAFTGASKGGKPGLFELAHTGTIFLDEISEISRKLQGRLLRVLQEKEVMRLGHDRVIPINVRVISATNKDLYNLVEKGDFREDLYYRLDILKIDIPPLRERREDILAIADHFITNFCLQFKKEKITLSLKEMEDLLNYCWPGNIRELSNVFERLVVLNQGEIINKEDVSKVLPRRDIVKFSSDAINIRNSENLNCNYTEQVKKIERERILTILEKAGYNKGKAAEILGISRTTLWRQMKELDIRYKEKAT
jgi:transcriptional regulator with PAS, ATPase and Fis domain